MRSKPDKPLLQFRTESVFVDPATAAQQESLQSSLELYHPPSPTSALPLLPSCAAAKDFPPEAEALSRLARPPSGHTIIEVVPPPVAVFPSRLAGYYGHREHVPPTLGAAALGFKLAPPPNASSASLSLAGPRERDVEVEV